MAALIEKLRVMLFVAFESRISLMVVAVGLRRMLEIISRRVPCHTSSLLAQSIGAVERGTERPDTDVITIKARVTNNSVQDMTDR